MRKSKVSPSEFTAFTVSEFLRENQQDGDGGGGKITPHTPRLGKIFRKKNSDPPLWKFDSFQNTSVENMEQKTIVKFMAFLKLF